jgi:hypothetical protein
MRSGAMSTDGKRPPECAQLAEWPTSRLSAGVTGKLGQPKQRFYAGSMITLSPEAFAGHTPMMQHYLRLI